MSVVIPTYNNGDTINRCLRSALGQSYDHTEIIVVDDASTDDTGEKLTEYVDIEAVRVITHHTNRGAAAARNSGLSAARGEYIAFLDADDEWDPRKLAKQLRYMKEGGFSASYTALTHKKTQTMIPLRRVLALISSVAETDAQPVNEGGEELVKRVLNLEFDIGGTSTLVVTRELTTELAGFDPQFARHTDWEFLIRLLKKTEIGYVDEPLVTKYHTGSPSVAEIEKAQTLFFKKFADDIETYTKQGVPIEDSHRFRLVEKHLFKGEFVSAARHLRHVTISQKRLLKLAWASIRGARAKFRGRNC